MEEKNSWNKLELWQNELEILKSIVAKTALVETKKWGGIVYTYNHKNVIGIGGFKSYFGVWFFNGAFLTDKAKVLVNAQEGITKALRQWRFTTKEEIDEKLLLAYIKEAIENEKNGRIHKPEKKQIISSEFLNQELDKDKALSIAFGLFAPYKQKEFIAYIESAKQEKTKAIRMEKIRHLILENKGLNDKYK